MSGAVGAVSTTLQIATAATNHNTRHPLVTAGYATTMHRLTGGRFTLGLGRGIAPMMKAIGLKPATTAQLEDFAGLMRRLWHGETIIGHDGPAGSWPFLRLDATFDEDIPLGVTAFGPNTLRLAGRAFDQVVLHTFFEDETLVRCVRTVKEEAERVGRNPDSVKVWSCLATIGDHLPEPVQLKKTVGRMATYLQAYGDLMVETNHWDPAALARFRADPFVAGYQGAIDQTATTERARARRHPDPAGVAGAGGDRLAGALRRGDPAPVRPRCRRGDPPRRRAGRAGADRRGVGVLVSDAAAWPGAQPRRRTGPEAMDRARRPVQLAVHHRAGQHDPERRRPDDHPRVPHQRLARCSG